MYTCHALHPSLHTRPTTSQSNSNAQVIKMHALESIPPSQNPSLPSSSEVYTPPTLETTNLLRPAGPPVADYLLSALWSTSLKRADLVAISNFATERKCWGARVLVSRSPPVVQVILPNSNPRARIRPTAIPPLHDRNLRMWCGWQNEDRERCGARVMYNHCAEHFTAVNHIKNKIMASDVDVRCRWCALSVEKVILKYIVRHMRDVH
ncbi:hypothetical protein EDC04DRAFT_944188 [Pisolithus marmoratus]|nr:hypothetical protein EDC04DRAFT_944188 [Pisolithus marmoratus]